MLIQCFKSSQIYSNIIINVNIDDETEVTFPHMVFLYWSLVQFV